MAHAELNPKSGESSPVTTVNAPAYVIPIFLDAAMIAQVSTPPLRMIHRLDFWVGSSPPVRLCIVAREDSKLERNSFTLVSLRRCDVVVEFVMVASYNMVASSVVSAIVGPAL